MKRVLFLNFYIVLGFVIGFLLLDFCYLCYTDDFYYAVQNFVPTSIISFLFYRIYLLFAVLFIFNILEIINSKLYNYKNKFSMIDFIAIALFLITYGISVDNYFFIIPALVIIYFLNIGNKKG